jgi:hypothetical protein
VTIFYCDILALILGTIQQAVSIGEAYAVKQAQKMAQAQYFM